MELIVTLFLSLYSIAAISSTPAEKEQDVMSQTYQRLHLYMRLLKINIIE